MMPKALFIEQSGPDPVTSLREIGWDDLPEGDLDVAVLYSSLNYKDALAVTGSSPIVRAPFPFVPGIDLAGRVARSRHDAFREGDLVLQTGWGLGESRFGGHSELARIKAEHAVRIPEGMAPRSAMVVGTAGFTAMLACMALEDHGMAWGPLVVTGASGGVGGFSIAFLSRLGHEVVASTGSGDKEYLRQLGAADAMDRAVLGAGAARPLDSGRWGGAVDSVGGKTLEALISQVGTRGAVAACGLAGGTAIQTTVFPFILRGVGLLGIDSNTCPTSRRVEAWSRIAALVDDDLLDLMTEEIPLIDVGDHARLLLEGGKRGRTVVRCKG